VRISVSVIKGKMQTEISENMVLKRRERDETIGRGKLHTEGLHKLISSRKKIRRSNKGK
jgi:hypothetical protein